MSKRSRQDVEEGPGSGLDPHQPTPNRPPREQFNFGDSSGPLFSMYSKAADKEDDKMVERWQKDAKGILIFAGLFSAALAALLAVSLQDLKQNSQDISAFHLANIYQVLADPNTTRVTEPPRFTPPRHAVWVNSLWFLSLVMTISCALLATSLQQWARRYIRMAQPPRCSPDKRARMRAFFNNGIEEMRVLWAVELLPTLLHLALFLFFGGLAVFLFNIDLEVFIPVVSWIGLFVLVYGVITLLPIMRHDSPYNSPLSTLTWYLCAIISYATFKIFASITSNRFGDLLTNYHFGDSRDRYKNWISSDVEKIAEETALAAEQSLKIDDQILNWTISTFGGGDDNLLRSFFDAIPGFLDSKVVKLKKDFPEPLRKKITEGLDGFIRRTWASNSVDDSEKVHRLNISMNLMNQINPFQVLVILRHVLYKHWDEVPQTVEMGHALAPWCTASDELVSRDAQIIVARILVGVRERSDSWGTLAAKVFCLPEQDLQDRFDLHGDSVLLAILIRFTARYLGFDGNYLVLEALSELNITKTHRRLQHEFCRLWDEIVREAKKQGPRPRSTLVKILKSIRNLYIALHPKAKPEFSAANNEYDPILLKASSYPSCDPDSHLPHSTHNDSTLHSTPPGSSPDVSPHPPSDGSDTASRQTGLSSNPTTTGKIGDTSRGPDMIPSTNSEHSSSPLIGGSPEAAAQQGVTSTTTGSRSPEGNKQQDSGVVAPNDEEPGTTRFSSTASTNTPKPTQALIPTSLPNTPPEYYNAGVASVSDFSSFAHPPIGSSVLASRSTGSNMRPRLRARGLANNTKNICFANAVFQLLVNSPPFRDLFWELCVLKRQHGAGVPETGGATPLVDATVKFFKEFIVDEESPSTQHQSQPATAGTSRSGDDEEKKDNSVSDSESFEPTYMYDAMKKTRLITLLDGKQQDAAEFLLKFLNALDEELLVLIASINDRRAALDVEVNLVALSVQAEVGRQGYMENNVRSLTTRIFGGKFPSPVGVPNQLDQVPTEDLQPLHLDIQPGSLRIGQDILSHISHPQSMQVSASDLNNTSQQTLIEAFPPVLVLHLNHVAEDGTTKTEESVQFTSKLNIPLDTRVPNGQRPHYKLHGVVYHRGRSAYVGHYTVDILRPNGDGDIEEGWLHIDDNVVRPIPRKDVFWWEHGTERATDKGSAYLLFYYRTSPIGTP